MIAITEMAALARSRTRRSFTVGLGHTYTFTCQAAKATSISRAAHGYRAKGGGASLTAMHSTMSSSQQTVTYNSDYGCEMLFPLARPCKKQFTVYITN